MTTTTSMDLWDSTGDGTLWYQELGAETLEGALSEERRMIYITRDGLDYELSSDEHREHHGTYPTLAEAKAAGDEIVEKSNDEEAAHLAADAGLDGAWRPKIDEDTVVFSKPGVAVSLTFRLKKHKPHWSYWTETADKDGFAHALDALRAYVDDFIGDALSPDAAAEFRLNEVWSDRKLIRCAYDRLPEGLPRYSTILEDGRELTWAIAPRDAVHYALRKIR